MRWSRILAAQQHEHAGFGRDVFVPGTGAREVSVACHQTLRSDPALALEHDEFFVLAVPVPRKDPARCGADQNCLSSCHRVHSLAEIGSYTTADLVYRLSLAEDFAITAAVFNVADRDPPVVRLTDYNYDPSFGNPIGRVFKVGVSKQFR